MPVRIKELDEFSAADVFDIRDLISRFEELEDERHTLEAEIEELQANLDGAATAKELDKVTEARMELAEWEADNGHEFKALQDFLDETKGYGGDEQWRGDWYPVTFIARSYFVDYCQDLVQEIGDLPQGIPGYLVIDWKATADNLEADYSTVDLDGNEFLYR